VCGSQRATYLQLDRQSDFIARSLIQKGVRPEQLVGLMSERSIEAVAGLLGILKAGCAYLPIAPDCPVDRLDFLAADGNVNIILAGQDVSNELIDTVLQDNWATDILKLETLLADYQPEDAEAPDTKISPDSLAYVTYTSGSTGRPKGVAVEHRSVVNILHWFGRTFKIKPGTPLLQLTDYTFDPSIEDVFGTLTHGGVLHMADRELVLDRDRFRSYIDEHAIEIINFVPTMLTKLLCPGEKLAPLRVVISGGERLEESAKEKILHTGYALYNNYGPTETTVDALSGPCQESTRVNIGQPVANTQCHILDRSGQPTPIGIAGELHFSGAGIARGYINKPELCAEQFACLRQPLRGERQGGAPLESPFALRAVGGELPRVYKTGDLGRWLPDGNVEFMGRVDRQVKIRGYRVELGEIENCLLKYDNIKEAVTVALPGQDAGKILCAYFVPTHDTTVEITDLRDHMSKSLPSYMVPSYFIPLENIPLTPNGKIDKTQLPTPSGDIDTGVETIAPTNQTEQQLADIWQEVLGMDTIGIKHNFFESGGNSIIMIQSLVRIREEMQKEVSLKTFFENPTIETLATAVEGTFIDETQRKKEEEARQIKPVPGNAPAPLSFPQERIWFLENLYQDYIAYYVPRAIRIKGTIEKEMLEKVFTEIIRRHEILRTRFYLREGKAVQEVFEPFDFNIIPIDLTDTEASPSRSVEQVQEEKVKEFILGEGRLKFDLEKGPLIRAHLLKLAEEHFMLVLCEHHLVHDGWTQGVLLREFIAIYLAFSEGKPSPFPELPIQYKDYAWWQRNYFQGEVLEKHLDYWKEKLSGLPPVINLPSDRPRPPVMSGSGRELVYHVPADLSHKLISFSHSRGVTLYMTMLAVFKTLLYRYTGVEDLCVGAGIAGRLHKEMEGMLGMVINTIVLRNQVHGDITFDQCLQRIKNTCLEAYQYEETPLEKVVEVLRPERSLSYTPLFQILFSFMDVPAGEFELPGLELRTVGAHNRTSKFDINVIIVPANEQDPESEILVEWEYNTDIYEEETVDRMYRHYTQLLASVIEMPETQLFQLPLMEEEESKRLLVEFNSTEKEFPQDKTIHQLFEEQVEKSGESTALIATGEVTYNELNRRADEVAQQLREKGVGSGSIVAIQMERSPRLIESIIGILKAGCAYLPIDPDYPQARIDYILKDSNAATSLLHEVPSGFQGAPPFGGVQGQRPLPPEALAYIIYTSGSTGTPKGVAVEHRSVVNLLHSLAARFDMEAGDRLMLKTSFLFDVSVSEIFGWIVPGAALAVLEPGGEKDPQKIIDAVESSKTTRINFVPSMFNAFLDYLDQTNKAKITSLKTIILAGEALPPDMVKRFNSLQTGIILENLYGPTEATVYATGCNLHQWPGGIVSIGQPLPNTKILILDSHNNPQPILIPGQLCITGQGLARGYINNPELTAEQFACLRRLSEGQRGAPLGTPMALRAVGGELSRVYKTGDLARWLPNGEIEFMGRMDYQVKIRGFRIELGEIETRLTKHEAVKETVVLDKSNDNGDKFLCAFITPENNSVELPTEDIRNFLAHQLPEYMIPSYFTTIDEIPLTTSGKADRKKLLELEVSGLETQKEYIAPRNDVEKEMQEIWETVLGKDSIGIDDAFFTVGGDSIKAIQVAARMKPLGYKIEIKDFFRHATISQLAQTVKKVQHVSDQSTVTGPVTLTPIQHWFLQKNMPLPHHFNQAVMLFSKEGFPEESVKTIFQKLITHHDALRCVLKKEKDSYTLTNQDDSQPLALETIDLRGHDNATEKLEAHAAQIQASIDLENGPLLKLGLFHLDDGDRLLIVIHHLVIDGVSWRLIFEDVDTLYTQHQNGKQLTLPPKTDSFKRWSEKLSIYANSKTQLQEKDTWNQQETQNIPPVEKDFPESANYVKDAETVSFSLSEAETGHLVTSVNEAFSTEINDILLSAFGLAMKQVFRNEKIVVNLEGHGREGIMPDVDIARTIGWFTTIYPVVLDISHEADLSRQIKEIKESLHRVPAKGIGYGILKHLTWQEYKSDVRFELEPRISFNYLGEFDSDLGRTFFSIASESPGPPIGPGNERNHELEVSGMITGNCLQMSIVFNTLQFKAETVQGLADAFKAQLLSIIQFCMGQDDKDITPSDFGLDDMSIDEFDALYD
ncbi:MAG: amino acid adenylation domain-containing protein, partial [bacterium]|nr:amino acid adenylation domain-containing protein [bacterium]